MRNARSKVCVACGPLIEESVMVEFDDADDDAHTLCVDCLMGIFESVDFPQESMNAFAAAWASLVLGIPVTAVDQNVGT